MRIEGAIVCAWIDQSIVRIEGTAMVFGRDQDPQENQKKSSTQRKKRTLAEQHKGKHCRGVQTAERIASCSRMRGNGIHNLRKRKKPKYYHIDSQPENNGECASASASAAPRQTPTISLAEKRIAIKVIYDSLGCPHRDDWKCKDGVIGTIKRINDILPNVDHQTVKRVLERLWSDPDTDLLKRLPAGFIRMLATSMRKKKNTAATPLQNH